MSCTQSETHTEHTGDHLKNLKSAEAVFSVYGTPHPLASPTFISLFCCVTKQNFLQACKSIPFSFSSKQYVFSRQQTVCITARRVCATVRKTPFVHEFLILNANTVTCKHVFQLNFKAVCSSLSGQPAFAYIKAHPHCVACSEPPTGKKGSCTAFGKAEQKVLRGKQSTIQHTLQVADQT